MVVIGRFFRWQILRGVYNLEGHKRCSSKTYSLGEAQMDNQIQDDSVSTEQVESTQQFIQTNSAEEFRELPEFVQRNFHLGYNAKHNLVKALDWLLQVRISPIDDHSDITLKGLRDSLKGCSEVVWYNSNKDFHFHNCNHTTICYKCRQRQERLNQPFTQKVIEQVGDEGFFDILEIQPILNDSNFRSITKIVESFQSIVEYLDVFLNAQSPNYLGHTLANDIGQVFWKLDIKANDLGITPKLRLGVISENKNTSFDLKCFIQEFMPHMDLGCKAITINDESVDNADRDKKLKGLILGTHQLTSFLRSLNDIPTNAKDFIDLMNFLEVIGKVVCIPNVFNRGSFGNKFGEWRVESPIDKHLGDEALSLFKYKYLKPSQSVLKQVKLNQ